MKSLPVKFVVEGKQYSGELRKVAGAREVWHLMVQNFYQGHLLKTRDAWDFASNDGRYPKLTEQFGKLVEANLKI